MPQNWYYVDGDKKVGPIDKNKVLELIDQGDLNQESYVWYRGLDNWIKVKDAKELSSSPSKEFDWRKIGSDEKIFIIKTGFDRNNKEVEYGPFDLHTLKLLAKESRINQNTYIFTPGMDDWELIGSTELADELFPGVQTKTEKRKSKRRPFVARMFFHDEEQVYEGVCRDVSVGGLQVLVQNFPAKVGDTVSLNVHPENKDYSFTASGKIVRLLEGGQGFSLRFEELDGDALESIKNYINNE